MLSALIIVHENRIVITLLYSIRKSYYHTYYTSITVVITIYILHNYLPTKYFD